MKNLVIDSEQTMIGMGERLGEQLRPGDLLFLSGDLGAGKTTLTKGIARGLGISGVVTSPTFQLRKTYRGRIVLNHLDLYRLESPKELEVLDPEEILEEGVTVVEWGWIMQGRFPDNCLEIDIEYGPSGEERMLTFHPHGERFRHLVKELEPC